MHHPSAIRARAALLLFLLGSVAPLIALDWPNVPVSIREAVEAEFPGFTVEEVEYDDRRGSPIYAVKGEAQGAEIELEVRSDGTIVRAQVGGIHLIESEDNHDHDGMGDADESARGCDPLDPDTDDDAFPDGFEDTHGSDPLDPASQPRIMSIRTECADGGGPCLVVSVETFTSGTFQLEICDGVEGWRRWGDPFAGNGAEAILEFPLTQENRGGLLRVTVRAHPEETTGGGTGLESCAAPDSIQGLTFVFADETGKRKTYVMATASTGHLTEEIDGEVEFYPFDYRYEKAGPCGGTIRITFPSDREEAKGVVVELTFTSPGTGHITLRRFEGSRFEDTETGIFQLSH